jgi:hypothetical protein
MIYEGNVPSIQCKMSLDRPSKMGETDGPSRDGERRVDISYRQHRRRGRGKVVYSASQ